MTPHPPLALPPLPVLALAVLVTLGYIAVVVEWPFVNCRRCGGTGRRKGWFSGNAFRICRRCGGTGRRLRIARKAWNYLHARRSTALTAEGRRTPRQAARQAARDTERNAR